MDEQASQDPGQLEAQVHKQLICAANHIISNSQFDQVHQANEANHPVFNGVRGGDVFCAMVRVTSLDGEQHYHLPQVCCGHSAHTYVQNFR